MMHKRSIMSLLLAFCLCFSMITPAMAAEVNSVAQVEAQAMSRLAGFDFVQSEDANEATFNIDGESVLIQNLSETVTLEEISKTELADIIETIADVRETELDEETEVINYYCLIDDKVYLYEETIDDFDNAESKLLVYDMDKEKAAKFAEQLAAMEGSVDVNNVASTTASYKSSTSDGLNIENWYGSLDNGVAARLYVNKSSISFMQATLKVPKLSDLNGVDNKSVTNYIYLGFTGSNVESDIGLASGKILSTDPLLGFKPYFYLGNKGVHDGFDVDGKGTNTIEFINETPDGSGVKYFLPSPETGAARTIDMVVYKKVQDDVHFIYDRIRGTLVGDAIYGENMKQARVKVIMDSTRIKGSQLAPILNWKIVNTLTPEPGTSVASGTKSSSTFTGIKIDGQAVPLSICKGQIYNKGAASGWGNITQVKSGSNLGTLTFNVICGK